MASRVSSPLAKKFLPVGKAWDGTHGHYDTNRAKIECIVIHSIVGTIQGATSVFTNDNPATTRDTSAHYGVGLNGEIYQWVSESATAYHAGVYSMNQKSIGIEHDDNGQSYMARTDELYHASAQLVADLCTFYGIPCDSDHIITHKRVFELHPESNRGTACPAGLDIERIIREAQAILSPVPVLSEAEIRAHLTTKATSLDGIGFYLGFTQDEINSHEFNRLAVERIQKLVQESEHQSLSTTLSTDGNVVSSEGYATSQQHPEVVGLFDNLQRSIEDIMKLLKLR